MNEPLQQHPLAKIIPPASDEEFAALCESIRVHGYSTDHDIVIYEGMILDGFTSELACREVGVKPTYIHFIAPDMADSPLDFVIQENLTRRHLSVSQRAAIAVELMERSLGDPDEEKPEGEAPIVSNDTMSSDVTPESHWPNTKPMTIPRAAEIMHVSVASVNRAKAKKKEGKPDTKKTEARQANLRTATKIIEDTLGEGWVKQSKISSADTIQLSGVVAEEMLRIKPYLDSGWDLKRALGYSATSLVYGHTLRDLCNRAIEFGKYTWQSPDEWVVTVTKK